MAVSANLRVAEELKAAFLAGQDGSKRYFVVRIDGEVLQLTGEQAATEDVEADFSTILGKVAEHEPSFVVFRRQRGENSDERPWTLISYVPDTSKVRQKMLYASSKKDLIQKLGTSLFTDDDFYVGEAADLTYDGLVHATRKATDEERAELLTEAEQAMEEEDVESVVHTSAPSGGGAVPFQFDEAATDALKAYAAGERQCVEIKIHPKKEICQLGALAGNTALENLESGISADEPRFYLTNYNNQKVFVYCCPELSKVRSRMLYSTCRATVIASANEAGIQFDKTTEMRDPSEIQDCLTIDSAPHVSQPAKEVTKAVRKTRGKRRLNKKISWT